MSDPLSWGIGVGIVTNLASHPLCKALDSESVRRLLRCSEDHRLSREFAGAVVRAFDALPVEQRRYARFLQEQSLLRHEAGFELHKLFGATEAPDASKLAAACRQLFPELPANIDVSISVFLRGIEAELRKHKDFAPWIAFREVHEIKDGVSAVQGTVEEIKTTLKQSSAPTRRVCTLPRSVADFTGREAELARLAEVLAAGGRANISAVTGMGGVGKTALAVEAAWRASESFPDGILFIDLGGFGPNPLGPEAALTNLINQIDHSTKPPEGLAPLMAAYHRLLAGHKRLLLLDNAKDLAQVEGLVPPQPTALLVTSRLPILLPGVRPLPLDALPEAKAAALLQAALHGRAVEDADLTRIAAACTRLPIALRAAGAFLAEHRNWTIVEYLAALETSRLQHMKSRHTESLDVTTVLRFSIDRLAEDQPPLAARWRLLAVFPGDFDTDAASAVWACEPREAGDGLEELVDHSLLLHDKATGRWRLHDLYRELAQENVNEQTIESARERHARYYSKLFNMLYYRFYHERNEPGKILTEFDLEKSNIEIGQSWAAACINKNEEAARIVVAYARPSKLIFLRFTSWQQIDWYEISVKAAKIIEDQESELYSLGNLAIAWGFLGTTEKEFQTHKEIAKLAISINDYRSLGNAVGNIGRILLQFGYYFEAIYHLQERIAIEQNAPEPNLEGEANSLGNLGVAWRRLGCIAMGIYYHGCQLMICREIDEPHGFGDALTNLAQAWQDLGDYINAVEYENRAFAHCKLTGDMRNLAGISFIRARRLIRSGQADEAVNYAQEAYRILAPIGDTRLAPIEAMLRDLGIPPTNHDRD